MLYLVVIETTGSEERVKFLANSFDDAYNKVRNEILSITFEPIRIKSLTEIEEIKVIE